MANWLYACINLVEIDSTTSGWSTHIGAWASMHGTLRTGTIAGGGGYRLNLNELPANPNPKIP